MRTDTSHFKRTSTGRMLIYLISLFVLIVPYKHLNAQASGALVSYSDSILEDEENRRLSFPSSVFIDPEKDEVYIINKGRIIIYTSDLFPVFTMDKSSGIETPQGLTVSKEGKLFVSQGATKENPRHRISVFNACLKWEEDLYFGGFEKAASFTPLNLAIDSKGNLYVTGAHYPGVLILNQQGKLLEILTIEKEGRKVCLNDVEIDNKGQIYLVSEEEGRVYVYDENRKSLFEFGQKGGSTAKLSRPQAVAVDNRNGRKYVIDYMRHTALVYDSQGEYLSEFGGLGWGEGWFQYPKDVAVDSQGRIFIADTFNDRIDVFKPNE